MKRTLLFFMCMLASMTMQAQVELSDYIPFVENGKKWFVIRSDADAKRERYVYRMTKYGAIMAGKAYMQMVLESGTSVGLLREENRKVYMFDTDMQKEFLVFDYSLKVGDTYETYSYDEQKVVSYKVLSVGYSTEGHEVIYYEPDENSITTNRRYLREWTVCRTDDESCQKTWIEGAGSLEGPLANLYDSHPISSKSYLLFVEWNMGQNLYIPFQIHDYYSHFYGCNFPLVAASEPKDSTNLLTYELEGDRLHIYGNLPNWPGLATVNYAFFVEEPTDNPLVRKLNMSLQIVMVEYPRRSMGIFPGTDFYLSGLDPNINYIVVDQWGEHPVINKTPQTAYRPFVEDGKVWKVGGKNSGNPVQLVEYYYFDGDTIIGGKACKKMMCQRYVSPDFSDDYWTSKPSLSYVGAWYEEDQKVYRYYARDKQFRLWYDFSADANDTLQIYEDHPPYIISPRKTGGIKGFKGIYRDVMMTYEGELLNYNISTWMEGVGNIAGPIYCVYIGEELYKDFLMSCTVGDEVIYLNDEYEDGATPEALARKDRIDFTHTIKIKPKTRMMREAEPSLYGEYSEQQLGINLNPLDDAYVVRITDDTGKTVYEKAVNAGNIVGLNIDISAYAEGRYTVTVENDNESFTGGIDTRTTGIKENGKIEELKSGSIYNLQGQRISTPRKGLNIVNGRKAFVK